MKWPRIWQDTFDNSTPVDSLHQRVCLASCEVLLDLEFPEDTAEISAEVGGRGFTLDTEDEEELLVRNYRAVLHGIKVDTRKMRRLKELEDLDPDAKLARHASESLSFETEKHVGYRGHTSHAHSGRHGRDRSHAPHKPSYDERHASRAHYRQDPPSSPYQYSDPGTARVSEGGSQLGVPRDYHSSTGRPRSTASEEIRRRAMQRW